MWYAEGFVRIGVQAYNAEENDPMELEDVCYAQCEAEDYAENAGPVILCQMPTLFLIHGLVMTIKRTIDHRCLHNIALVAIP